MDLDEDTRNDVVGEDGFTQRERDQMNMTSAAFEALERDFREVLNEVVGGKSLEKFRLEYDKLHHTLKKSHENERRLIRKCRELNAEIASNATKIQTALKLSVQDQNSITLLKKELDKAWKMVDGAQEREKRARETIQRLNVEIQNLSLLVDQGAGLSIGQENAVNELLKIKDELTRELESRNQLLISTKAQLEDSKTKIIKQQQQIDELNKEVTKLSEEKIRLQNEQSQYENDNKLLTLKIKNLEVELGETKAALVSRDDAVVSGQAQLKQQIALYKELEKERSHLQDLLHKEKQTILDMDLTQKKMAEVDQIHQKTIKDLEEKVKAKEKEMQLINNKLKQEHLSRQRVEKERDQAKDRANQAEKYKDWLRGQFSSMLDTVKSQRDDAAVDEALIRELKQHIKRLSHAVHLANQTNQDQYKLVEDNEQIKKSLEEDIKAHKNEEQELRARNYQLEKQKEKAAMNATIWYNKLKEAEEIIKLKEMETQELAKQVADERNKLRLQQTLCEQVRSDRNKFSKMQAQQKDDIAEMCRKFKIMSHQIEQLKEEIRNKDNALINEHFAYKRMQAEMKVARRKLAKRKEVLATADQVLSSQDAEIKALRRQVIEAEVAHHQQERAYDELMQERDILGTQLIRRNDELALLYEKIRIQQSTLHKGEAQYRERLQDLRALKFAINGLKYELQRRIRDTTSAEALKTEITHMQRELLQERTKVKALSEELENPTNVHRWRSLDGTDPKKYELIQKIQMLQKRLISKTEEVVGKDLRLEEQEKLYTALKNVVARQPGPELAEQLSVYQAALKEKTRQMKAMAAELNMFQARSNEHRYEIDKLTKESQDLKRKYFEQRRLEQLNKQQTLGATRKDPLLAQHRAFFATQPTVRGGGYNITMTQGHSTSTALTSASSSTSSSSSPSTLKPTQIRQNQGYVQ